MSDLNRKKFEAWYIQKANKDTGMCMSMADIAGKRGPKGDYDSYGYLHGCWVGWQASRGCLVIELPEQGPSFTVAGVTSFSLKNEGRNEAIKEIEVSIHASGVQTK